MSAILAAQLTRIAFNRLGYCVGSPGNIADTVTQNSPVPSAAVVVIVVNIHFADPRTDGQAEFTWAVD